MPSPIDPTALTNGSVIQEPRLFGAGFPYGDYSFVLNLASVADSMPAWGQTPALRDQALRAFWPTEPMFASALLSTIGRYAAFGWTVEGPPLTAAATQRLLHSSEIGQGWVPFITKTLIDLFTQDNGAFIEVVRAGDSPTAAPLGLNHLDAARCYRTGIAKTPVIYYDERGKGHLMKWYQVIPLAEAPSPKEEAHGMQYCALSRVLGAARLMRDELIYKREKAGGRFEKAIHLVSGMPTRMIEDALAKHRARSDAEGTVRYVLPAIIGTIDPTASVTHAQIDLASLPDGYDLDKEMRWYITNLAMAFGTDYQDFAPSPGMGIGSGSESRSNVGRSRGKGAAVFMTLLSQAFNFHGVMPSTVRFKFGEQDVAEQFDKEAARKERALRLEILVNSNIITRQVARQILVDNGDLDPRYLEMMREQDATGEIQLPASTPPTPETPPVKPGQPGPNAPAGPATGPSGAPPNNNAEVIEPTANSKRPVVTS